MNGRFILKTTVECWRARVAGKNTRATIDLRLAHSLLWPNSLANPVPNPRHREAAAFLRCGKLMPPLTLSSSLVPDGVRMGRGASMVTQKTTSESTVETLIVRKLRPRRKNTPRPLTISKWMNFHQLATPRKSL